jgi:hypothetical protein
MGLGMADGKGNGNFNGNSNGERRDGARGAMDAKRAC